MEMRSVHVSQSGERPLVLLIQSLQLLPFLHGTALQLRLLRATGLAEVLDPLLAEPGVSAEDGVEPRGVGGGG